MKPIEGAFSTTSTQATSRKKLFIKSLFASEFIILLILVVIANKSIFMHYIKILFCLYLIIDMILLIQRDMRKILLANTVNLGIIYLISSLAPIFYFYTQQFDFFIHYWPFLIIGFYGLLFRQLSLPSYKKIIEKFPAVQPLLTEGIIVIGVSPFDDGKNKLTLYKGTKMQKFYQKAFDLICLIMLIYFLYSAFSALSAYEQGTNGESYVLAVGTIVCSLLLTQMMSLSLLTGSLYFKYGKGIKQRFEFASYIQLTNEDKAKIQEVIDASHDKPEKFIK